VCPDSRKKAPRALIGGPEKDDLRSTALNIQVNPSRTRSNTYFFRSLLGIISLRDLLGARARSLTEERKRERVLRIRVPFGEEAPATVREELL
jgi:hypothetical protein